MDITPEILSYIWDHREEDVRRLALNHPPFGKNDFIVALNAIQARQKLQTKWQEWAKNPQVFIPESVIVEQSSNPETAIYKTRFIRSPHSIVLDLSGGMGADSYAFSQYCDAVIYLEANDNRVQIARHNFFSLGINNITCHTGRAENEGVELAKNYQPDLIFIDPDRRAYKNVRTFFLNESSPDVTTLIPRLLNVSPHSELLIKLSPMLDISYLEDALPYIFDLHIVSLHRDAKELLLHIYPHERPKIVSLELQRDITFTCTSDPSLPPEIIPFSPEVGAYIYDLYPAFAKVGYPSLQLGYPVWQPAQNTHLYFSHQYLPDFPGRVFRVIERNTKGKKWLKQIARTPLHLITKNIHTTTDTFRKTWHIQEGGERFLLVYGSSDGNNAMVLSEAIR